MRLNTKISSFKPAINYRQLNLASQYVKPMLLRENFSLLSDNVGEVPPVSPVPQAVLNDIPVAPVSLGNLGDSGFDGEHLTYISKTLIDTKIGGAKTLVDSGKKVVGNFLGGVSKKVNDVISKVSNKENLSKDDLAVIQEYVQTTNDELNKELQIAQNQITALKVETVDQQDVESQTVVENQEIAGQQNALFEKLKDPKEQKNFFIKMLEKLKFWLQIMAEKFGFAKKTFSDGQKELVDSSGVKSEGVLTKLNKKIKSILDNSATKVGKVSD